MKKHETKANDDMIEGYLDGFGDERASMPVSLDNRSRSYKHGWLNGRDDRIGKPRKTYPHLIEDADNAMAQDAGDYT